MMKVSELVSRFNPIFFIKPSFIIIIENYAGRSFLSIIEKIKYPAFPFSFRLRSAFHYNSVFTAAATGNILSPLIHSLRNISLNQLISSFSEILYNNDKEILDFSSADVLLVFLSDEFSPPEMTNNRESFSYPDEHFPLIYSGALPVNKRLSYNPIESFKLFIDSRGFDSASSFPSFCNIKMLNLAIGSGLRQNLHDALFSHSSSSLSPSLKHEIDCSRFPLIAVLPSHFFMNYSVFPFFVFSIPPRSDDTSFIKGTLSFYSASGIQSRQLSLNSNVIHSGHDLEPLHFALQTFNDAPFHLKRSGSPVNVFILDYFSNAPRDSADSEAVHYDINDFIVHHLTVHSSHLLYVQNILSSGDLNSFWSPSVVLQWLSPVQNENSSFGINNKYNPAGQFPSPAPLQKSITSRALLTASLFFISSLLISIILFYASEYLLEDSKAVSSRLAGAERSYSSLLSQNNHLNKLLSDYFSSLPSLKSLNAVVYSKHTDSLFVQNPPLGLMFSLISKCSPGNVYFLNAALDNSEKAPALFVTALALTKNGLTEYTDRLQAFLNNSLPPPYKVALKIISVEAMSPSGPYTAYCDYLLQDETLDIPPASPAQPFLVSFSLVPF